jgi:DNA-binding transcriptional regulator YiaG
MTGKEYQQALQRLDLSAMQMARLIEMDYATTKRWRTRGVPEGPASILIRMLAARAIRPMTVRKYHEAKP